MDRAHARRDARPGAAHRAHRRPRRVDGRRRAARRARLLLHGRLGRRAARVDPEDLRRDRPPRCTTPTRGSRFLDEQGIHGAGAVPERRRVRERLLPAARRPRAGARTACGPTTTSCTDWCSVDPDRLLADHRVAVLGRRPRRRRAAALRRARPPRGELLQPAAGPRPAAARAPALGPGVGGGAGGRRLGQLPRRRRVDGHAVRRRAPRWGG